MNTKKKKSLPEIEVCFLPNLGEDRRVARNSQRGLWWWSGGGAPALKHFAFVFKYNLILGLF